VKYLKYFSIIKFCLIILLVIGCAKLQAQPVFSKTLPQPRFFVLGLEKNDFPRLENQWDDTLALINYGKRIDIWLTKNKLSTSQIELLKSNQPQINTALFKALNEQQKNKFKEVAKILSYVIIGQKVELMKLYNANHTVEKSKQDFINDVEQIYFIHQSDLNVLFKLINDAK
jgi:hypothetical protein